MFDHELTTSPWHYYVFKHYQEFYTKGDWDGKYVRYIPSKKSVAWREAIRFADDVYMPTFLRWPEGRHRTDSRPEHFCRDWSNAFSENPEDHISLKLVSMRKRVAVVMGLHKRLNVNSPLKLLEEEIVQDICKFAFKNCRHW
jgi:hypothetical protein